jgi:hypothetical protein
MSEYRSVLGRAREVCARIDRYRSAQCRVFKECVSRAEVHALLQHTNAQIERLFLTPAAPLLTSTAGGDSSKSEAAHTTQRATKPLSAELWDITDVRSATAPKPRKTKADAEADAQEAEAVQQAADAEEQMQDEAEEEQQLLSAAEEAELDAAEAEAEAEAAASAEPEAAASCEDTIWDQQLLPLHRTLSALHVLSTAHPTVALVGAPNVGKSSVVRAISSGTPNVQNYPFTTRGISVGHMTLPARSAEPPRIVQVTDTPGLLYRADTARNKLEHFTLALLTHVTGAQVPRPLIVFVVDASGHCSFPLAMQLKLREEMYSRFALRHGGSHVWIDVVNKLDLGFRYYRFVNPPPATSPASASDSSTASSTSSAVEAKAAAKPKRHSKSAVADIGVPLEWQEHELQLADPNTLAQPLSATELKQVQARAVELLGYKPEAFISTQSGAGLDRLRTLIAEGVQRATDLHQKQQLPPSPSS